MSSGEYMYAWVLAKNIGERLHDLRGLLKLTQAAFGDLAGVTNQQVSEWERGNAKPSRSRVQRLTQVHGWPIDMFAEGGPMPSEVLKLSRDGRLAVQVPGMKGREVLRPYTASQALMIAKAELQVYVLKGEVPAPEQVFRWLAMIEEATADEAAAELARAQVARVQELESVQQPPRRSRRKAAGDQG